MEPLAPPDHLHVTTNDPRERLDDVLSGRVDRADIDVRTFLLDPPPTAADLARTERRRLLVRRGSIAAAAIIAVLLVAPWPSGGADESAPSSPAEPPMEDMLPEPVHSAAPRAVRLDVDPLPARRTRPAARVRRVVRRAASAPAPAPTVHASAPVPAPRPAPSRPSAPAPTAASDAGGAIRAPVS